MYQAIVFLPLLGCLIAGLFGRFVGARGAELVTSALLIVSALLSWYAFVDVGFLGHEARVKIFTWIVSGGLKVDWALRIDGLTAVMLVVVTTVSALVHVYSIGYMAEDPHRPRFFSYLSLFTFAMLMLVSSDNLVQLFFGWEGVGLMSYLLIGFWYQKPEANAAAIKAFVVNRVGDFGFALGIFAVYALVGSVGFETVFAEAKSLTGKTIHILGGDYDALTVICLLLFLGAMGKSAQFLLHTWLPDAMEGPTPVSALIHAATMVTAGVFMVARLSPLFELAPTALAFVTFIGATTAFFASSVALVQNDIKRIIAYSTCAQLGYMFVAMGVGAYSVGMFHLFTHAFFKALLFLGAGSVITALHHEQDIRRMGGLRQVLPITYAVMVIATLSATGFPLTAGFFSKDAVIEAAYAGHNFFAGYAFWLTLIVAALTAFYSWRLVFVAFHGHSRVDHHTLEHAHESPPVMTIPLGVLAFGAIVAGFAAKGIFAGEGIAHFFRESIFSKDGLRIIEEMHHAPFWVTWAPTLMMVLGFAVAYWFYIHDPAIPRELARRNDILYRFLLNKWYFDEIYEFLFVRPAKWLGYTLWQRGDGWLIDGFGPDGVAARVLDVTKNAIRLQTGYLYHYAFVMLVGVALLISWFLVRGAG